MAHKVTNTIITVKLDDLIPHPIAEKIYGYKSKKLWKVLAKTMETAGQLEPVIINTKNVIISGHRRRKAAYSLGWTTLKAIRVEAQEEKDETVSIVYHNQQRKKSTIEVIREAESILGVLGLNQGARRDKYVTEQDREFGTIGRDRFEVAAKVIGDISGTSLRRLMDIVDFEKDSKENENLGLVNKVVNKELTIMRAHDLMKSSKKAKLDREDAKKKGALLKPEEIKGSFLLWNQSSEKMTQTKDKTIQVVFTSPPYYDLRNYGNTKKDIKELGHEATSIEFIKNLTKHFADVKRVLKDEGSFFVNIGDTIRDGAGLLVPNRLVLSLCDTQGWFLVNEIIWQKTNAIPASGKRLQSSYEKIFHLVKNPSKFFYKEFQNWNKDVETKIVQKPGGRNSKGIKSEKGFMLNKGYTKFKDFIEGQNVENVIKGHNAAVRQNELKKLDPTKDHPALMPDYLPVIPILTTSKEGDTILDPFSGSATVGKCALLLGRKYVGYELNKDFNDLGNQVLSNTFQELPKTHRERIVNETPLAEFSK